MSTWSLGLFLLLGLSTRPAEAAPSSKPQTVEPSEREALLQSAEQRLQQLGVDSVRFRNKIIEREDIAESNLPVAVAWTLADLPERPEGLVPYESRRLVPLASSGQQPVQVRVDETQATVSYGEREVQLVSPTSTSRIRRDWQLGALDAEPGARWSQEALASLNAAMTLLTPSERAATTDLARIVRSPTDPRPDEGASGRYIRDEEDMMGRIELYDTAFSGSDGTFVGSVVSPMPKATTTVLQELARAFADHPARILDARHRATIEEMEDAQRELRRLWEALDPLLARQEEATAAGKTVSEQVQRRRLAEVLEAKDAYERQAALHAELMGTMDRQAELYSAMEGPGPVVLAYARIAGVLDGPTDDGRTSPEEGFAEAFAWWHVDPEGYARAFPEAAAWFEKGGHVAALKQVLGAIEMVSR